MTDHLHESDWADIGTEPYVSFGTFRASGDLISTPVWVAPDGDQLVVTTTSATAKVKRLRRDARVELQRCSRTGEPVPGSPVVHAHGVIAGQPDDNPSAVAALRKKYGLQYVLAFTVQEWFRRLRRRPRDRVILRLSPAAESRPDQSNVET